MAYATEAELYAYLDTAEPFVDAPRLLERASDLVDHASRYAIDLTDADHVTAARRAVVRQVEYWINAGEDVEYQGRYSSVSLGSLSLTYAGGGAGTIGQRAALAPRARRVLHEAGLLNRGLTLT